MITASDVEQHVVREFGSRLESLGFELVGKRKWVRSKKTPIRELFGIGALKGCRYSPAWGFSTGVVPAIRSSNTFARQSTSKNAVKDLIIDPVDPTGEVPKQSYGFLPGCTAEVPVKEIRTCAEHFLPLAVADFDRVKSLQDFCKFFLERRRLLYRRFAFDMYVQHRLAYGFVLIMTGSRDEGLERIRQFCENYAMEFQGRVLSECIRRAELQAVNSRDRD
jgi:hypothetical protein